MVILYGCERSYRMEAKARSLAAGVKEMREFDKKLFRILQVSRERGLLFSSSRFVKNAEPARSSPLRSNVSPQPSSER